MTKQGYLINEKYCKRCGKIKPVEEFWVNSSNVDGLGSKCKECAKQYHNKYYNQNRGKLIALQNQRYEEAKTLVFNHYSGNPPVCACCGETIREFLSVDHINNDGGKHRREMQKNGNDTAIYFWLVKHNFPKGFQILCYSCNLGRAHSKDKICPHKKVK